MSNSFTPSYCMPASWQPQVMLTSQNWKPCWAFSPLILSFHNVCPRTPITTSGGGSTPSAPRNLLAKSLVQVASQTMVRFQMPVLESVSLSSSLAGRGLGGSSQVGIVREEISDGRRQSVLKSLSVLSSQLVSLASTSGSLGTTGALLKDGGRVEVATDKLTLPSGGSTTSSLLTSALLSHAMLQVRKTQQMPLQEASTLHLLSSSLLSQSHMSSNASSQTSTVSCLLTKLSSELMDSIPCLNQNLDETLSVPLAITNRVRPLTFPPATSDPAVLPRSSSSPRPSAYAPHLTPIPSPFRPHCLARDRLQLWKPVRSQSSPPFGNHSDVLSEQDVTQIFEATSNAWAESTRKAYSSGILAYHVHCDKRNIPEHLRAPISHPLAASFITSLAGSYSGSTISNYIHWV